MSFWNEPAGVRSWLFTHDHKRVGVMFLATVTLFMALGGAFALVLRLSLVTPGNALVDADTYDRLFTAHGVVMVWLFMIPAIPSGLGNIFVPLMIGARDVAFPRLNLASYWVFVAGALIVVTALLWGGVDTGWTFYPPYSTSTRSAATIAAIGVFVTGVSSIMTGLNFIATIHTMRVAGLGWRQLPLFVWAIYGTAIILVLATPVLGLTLLLVAADHVWRLGLFDPITGGDPVLFEHLFWFYSHPAVYIMILPSMGVVSEVVSTFTHRRSSSYGAIVISTIGIAVVGFLTWGHHMFVAGMSTFDVGLFGLLSMLVAIFSAIKVFTWISTMYGGTITLATPLFYVFTFIFLFVFGGMSGVAVATTSLDVHWHDTYFVVAHFHFIMVGATMTAFLAALHYWFPKLTGRMYSEAWARLGCAAVSVGFVVTFTPQFLLGNGGMPRRYATYPAHFQALHVVSTCGAVMLAGGMLLTLAYLVVGVVRGPRAGDDPWRSRSFEWRSPSPPPPDNFPAGVVWVGGPYDYPDTEADAELALPAAAEAVVYGAAPGAPGSSVGLDRDPGSAEGEP
ncbi:MAG TPA: cbb3-type cytochrome c oxidase subunit I [Kofleriaceae bacterium]|nr:cbb3-type cytochrome c oxidase subunit I [Kofleriaceae bacterium]